MPPTFEELESMCARRIAQVRNGSVDRYGMLDVATVLLLIAAKLGSEVREGTGEGTQRTDATLLLHSCVEDLQWLSENVQLASEEDIRGRVLAADDALLGALRELR